MRRIPAPLVAPGTVVRQFSQDEIDQLVENWLGVFGKNRHGVNAKAYLWHIFSAARYPCSSGTAAVEHYKRQIGIEFIVLSNDRNLAFVTEVLPESSSLPDYYVFPPNLAWTMAFTHEDSWLGPYFAKHPRFDELKAVNMAKVLKAKEAEIARQRGWH